MRSSYLSAQRNAIDAERRSAAVQLQGRQEEIENLKDDVAVAHNTVTDQDASIQKACSLIAFYAERCHNWHLITSYFKLWVRNHRGGKQELYLEGRAKTWCAALRIPQPAGY
jgi:hypothetical protein